jgi:protein SCO1/2
MNRFSRRITTCLLASFILPTAMAGATGDLLVNDLGQPVPSEQLTGHWLLITFGYSHCPDVCPSTLHRVDSVLNRLGADGGRLVPYFVSVDPAHDNPAQLHRFLAHFSPRIRGLTGSPSALADARRTFGVPVRDAGAGFDHGVFLYLVAPDGRVVETLHPDVSADAMTQRIRSRMRASTLKP